MKEAASDRIVEMMKDGWRLYFTPHLRHPQGYVVQVNRRTFSKMERDKVIKPREIGSHEYILTA